MFVDLKELLLQYCFPYFISDYNPQSKVMLTEAKMVKISWINSRTTIIFSDATTPVYCLALFLACWAYPGPCPWTAQGSCSLSSPSPPCWTWPVPSSHPQNKSDFLSSTWAKGEQWVNNNKKVHNSTRLWRTCEEELTTLNATMFYLTASILLCLLPDITQPSWK